MTRTIALLAIVLYASPALAQCQIFDLGRGQYTVVCPNPPKAVPAQPLPPLMPPPAPPPPPVTPGTIPPPAYAPPAFTVPDIYPPHWNTQAPKRPLVP